MTAELKLHGSVNVDGKAASAELQKLVGNIAATKVELIEAKNKAAALSTEFKKLNRDTEDGAARANQLKEAMRGAQVSMFEAARAAASAETAYNKLKQSQGGLGNSAGQTRASMVNLGQQIGDVTQGIAAGTPLTTIYAQQIGQVAFAASGLGGVIGRVAGFLSGPWGAAITGGTVILGALWRSHETAAEKAEEQGKKEKTLAESLDVLEKATGLANASTAEAIRLSYLATLGKLSEEKANRELARTELSLARSRLAAAEADAQVGGAKGANFGGNFVTQKAAGEVSRLKEAFDKLDASITKSEAKAGQALTFANATAAAKALVDPMEKIRQKAEEAMNAIRFLKLPEPEIQRRIVAVLKDQKAAEDAVRDAVKAGTAAQREHNKELRDAERDAKKAEEALISLGEFAQKGVIGIRNSNTTGSDAITAAEARARADVTPRNDSLGSITNDKSVAAGSIAADAFFETALAGANAIGQAIGGSAGRALNTITAFAQGSRTGNFSGVGGAVGTLLNLTNGTKFGGAVQKGIGQSIFGGEGQAEIGKLLKPLKPMGDAIGKVFGDGGKGFGKLIGGAATGSAVAGLAGAIGIKLNETGAKIGGALGQVVGGPIGSFIGSILGGVVGGLFGPKGSTTVSASSGKVSQTSTGSASVQKATGAIGNTVTDALQSIADQLGGTIGDFSVSIGKKKGQFRVDSSGKGKLNGSTVTGVDSEGEALALAIADALKDGAIKTSPRVQAALTAYGQNVNKAVAEALKVKGLEDLLADRQNPFASTFRNLEIQLKQRVDIASKYGFDLVEIERINGEDRAKALKDTLASATGSVRNLLNDLQFGSRATGSATERLAGLSTERDRLAGLVRGGDTSQIDAVANVVQQIIDLQKETFGATGASVSGRADNIALLNDLVSQTDDRIKAAAEAAKAATATTNDKLTELNASADDQVALQREMAGRLAGIEQYLGTLTFGPSLVQNFARAL